MATLADIFGIVEHFENAQVCYFILWNNVYKNAKTTCSEQKGIVLTSNHKLNITFILTSLQCINFILFFFPGLVRLYNIQYTQLHINYLIIKFTTGSSHFCCNVLPSGSLLYFSNLNIRRRCSTKLKQPTFHWRCLLFRFWPLNCIKIGEHVALLRGHTVY